jgi:hypothetical protein
MDKLLELAAYLPAGLNDPRAMDKFHHERQELAEALAAGDRVGALLEAGDCLYYATKAQYNRLASAEEARVLMLEVSIASGFSIETIRAAAIAKYTLRARPGNPKDDAAERAAVAHLV